MAVSGKFLPSDTSPTRTIAGISGGEISEKGDMGKFLPGGERRLVQGVTSEVAEKGEMGKFLPRGEKRMVKGV